MLPAVFLFDRPPCGVPTIATASVGPVLWCLVPLPSWPGVVEPFVAGAPRLTVFLQVGFNVEGVATMPQGTIKKVIADKGFGFIEGARGDLFFHHSELQGIEIENLRVGQQVSYEEGRGPKGPRAEAVRPV